MIELKDLKKPTKKRINITIEPGTDEKLEKVAAAMNLSKSCVIWLALENYFKMIESK